MSPGQPRTEGKGTQNRCLVGLEGWEASLCSSLMLFEKKKKKEGEEEGEEAGGEGEEEEEREIL